MGASNAIAAFDLYAGLVPPTSLLLLVRMALVSKDSDEEPWYSEGHEMLARAALGRGRHAAVSRPDVKAVERAIEPLKKIRAITTDRAAAVRRDGSSTARYRLHLKAAHVPRKTGDVDDLPTTSRPPENGGRHREEDPPRPPENGLTSPEIRASRPPKSGLTSPGKRGTEEKEETERRQEEKSGARGIAKVLHFPSGELAVVASPPPENAQTITAAWVDHCLEHGVVMPSDLKSRYGKSIKQALDDGFTPDLIKRALGRMFDRNDVSWPHSLGAYLVRVQEAAATPRPKPSTTDRRVADALALAEQFDRKEIHG